MKKINEPDILICSTSFHETDRRLLRIIDALKEIGFNVTWFSRSLENVSTQGGFKQVIVSTFFKRGPLFYVEFNLRLLAYLLNSRHQIVCAVDLDTIPAVCFGRIVRRYTVTYDAHEIFYEVPELTGRPLKKTLWKLLAKMFLPKIKHNYTVNNSLAAHYSSKYRQEYQVVRNIPNFPDRKHEEKPYTKTLAYLGVLNKGRGVELAIEAMRHMPDYNLLLIGDGDRNKALREQASGCENVKFLGFVSPSNVMEQLSKADIGLNMLVADSLNYKYSLANKFFDYMHAGLPSINMTFPEYSYILEEHKVGVMINDYSAQALIQAISQVEKSYSELRENCYLSSPHFTWNEEKKKVQALYKALL